jgi:hypothetical protein
MARPSLFHNKKFKRLCHLLQLPRPQVVGLLETMWHACYETGDPSFRNLEEVEAAAEWWGEPGRFAAAIVKSGLVDELDDATYAVHDFWDHAPRAVALRRKRELSRKNHDLQQNCAHTVRPRAHGGAHCATAAHNVATPDTRHPNNSPNGEFRDRAGPPGSNVSGSAEPHSSSHRSFIDFFCQKWAEKYGTKYPFAGGKDGDHARFIVKHFGGDLERACRAVDCYLKDPDQFYAKDRHSLGVLRAQLRKFVTAAESPRPRPVSGWKE